MRWLTLCLVSANLGGMAMIVYLYAKRAATGPWWARLLPAHVWRVVAGTALLQISDFIGSVGKLHQTPKWSGLPLIAAANILIFWGVVYMILYQRHRLYVAGRPPGYQREDDPVPPPKHVP